MTPRPFLAGLLFALALPAHALEYRSTARPALLYDAPSTAAARLAVAGIGLPLEIVVDTEAWVKVRDPGGRLAWIEKAALGSVRTVMVKAETGSSVRAQPRADAEIVFRAAPGVLLTPTGNADPYGWLPVKHADGLAGWLPSHEVWGE
ncbi:MAG: SH3 domain-containing protein [Pseudomonadota bacterium]